MIKKVMIVVLLGFVGLVVGFQLDMFFPSNVVVSDALVLPANSPHSASNLVGMAQDDHHGVRIDYAGRSISFTATGSPSDAYRAVNLANKAVIAANDGKVKTRLYGITSRVPSGRYALIGLLAGIGFALGFLVPPRSRAMTTSFQRSRFVIASTHRG